ncbi:MAG TPA: single-stranded-DNA-specific exonuclease RecJ [Candidatus Dormibacteraeota bacterium]|nr:single-stranded-DNA-specific exonuclease RecJ [Candidatus Dormibacteraeota bacterium]
MSKQWQFDDVPMPDGFEPGRSMLLRRVLWSRRAVIGPDVAGFINAETNPLNPPGEMKGLPEGVALVAEALHARERIAIFGDYDADGVTATAVLQRGLTRLGGDVVTYIPHRLHDGYGLSADGLADLWGQGARLVISCDCGTNSADVVAQRPAGLRMVITDHHLPAQEIARPEALLNPHQPGCAYPFKDLSGAGVAYKLLEGVVEVVAPGAEWLSQLLQLVAIGAVADVVALLGENRTLVRRGLRSLQEDPLPGIQALLDAGGLRQPMNSTTIGFQLAPRINAAGRMDDARLALDLLLAQSVEEARPLAEHLERHNLARRQATDTALREAAERIELEGAPDSAIVMADPRWSLGLVGLVAGRLVDQHHVPAFVMNLGADECRGSARSIEGFNVVEALDACGGMLSRYGGHEAAAGFACPNENLPALVGGLQAYAASRRPEQGWSKLFPVDGEVEIADLTTAAVEELKVLEPFGQNNRPPRFCVRGVELKAASVFGQGEHMKLWIGNGDRVVEAVAWRRGKFIEHYRRLAQQGGRLDALFAVEVSKWDGEAQVRLELEDVKRSRP